jgi:hypothetical protein
MDPHMLYQIKRRELERQAAHQRLLSIAHASKPAGPSRWARATVSFGRALESAGQRLQARYAGLAKPRQTASCLGTPSLRGEQGP